MTTDMEAAKAFYAEVVGWGTQDASMPGMPYTLFTAGGASVSGLMDLPEDARKSGLRPSWLGYVGVDDVDAAADRIKRLGGAVHVPPTDIPNISRISVAVDPQMATIALFKWLDGGQEQPADTERTGPRRLARAARRRLGEGVGLLQPSCSAGRKRTPTPARSARISCSPPEDRRSAACSPSLPMEPVPFWLYYFNVGDIDEAVKRVKAGGGQILDGPIEVPGTAMDRPLHGPSGRHLRAGGKAEPQRHRIFRARRVARSV